MKKNILVGLAVLALSASPALAAHKTHHGHTMKHGHAMKPKASAAATNPGGASPMMGSVSAADRAMYKKNKHDSGVKS